MEATIVHYSDNGKENGSFYSMLGIMEQNME